jgi:hypothetical protein
MTTKRKEVSMRSFLFQNNNELLDDVKRNSTQSYVVFGSYSLVNELAEQVPDNVILCSTAGEFTPKGYCDRALTGFQFDSGDAEVVELLYPPVKSLEALKKAYQKVRNNKNAFAVLLCDGLSAMEEQIVTTFYFTEPDFKIVGGSAGDNLQFKETLIYIGKKRVHSVAIFFDSKTKTQILKENLYVPMQKRLLVTDADPIRRIVRKFDNKPAATEYAALLGVSEKNLPDYFMLNPLGRVIEGETYIASPMKVNSDKSITFYSQILPNTFVDILELADYNTVMKQTKSSIRINPSFALSINCILRSLYFIDKQMWPKVNEQLLSVCNNQTGFISYGEQYYRNHFNQTMVLLLVE